MANARFTGSPVDRLFVLLLALLAGPLAAGVAEPGSPTDPVFDLKSIQEAPLDAVVRKTSAADGIVTEEIEYTAEVVAGKPVRIFGMLAFPRGGKRLPALFWSQPGMAPAGTWWPQVFARKGYLCLNITLPHDVYDSFSRYTVETPRQGNLARLAVAQMRGITYLAQRPEADPDRIGVAGRSYGGLFATLIAGADPRVKAGLAFFVGGNHRLGSNFPQFTALRTAAEIAAWDATIDPAWRLRHRAVPFLWGIAANDPWMQLPAAVQTYQDAAGDDKRLFIAPNWSHALPEAGDRTLLDWFDIHLARTLPAYNHPSSLTITNRHGRLIATWSWTGSRRSKSATIVVSYGAVRPWHGWVRRYHHSIPATIDGATARADIPVPDPDTALLAYGNLEDERGALVSTEPIAVIPRQLGVEVGTKDFSLNTALFREFTSAEMAFAARLGWDLGGQADAHQKHASTHSLRAEGKAVMVLPLAHLPDHAHRLTLWVRAAPPATLHIEVAGLPPQSWNQPAVDILRREYGNDPDRRREKWRAPIFSLEARADTEWREVALDCPDSGTPVEGYDLRVSRPDGAGAWWIDTVAFHARPARPADKKGKD